jgi:hypothetical protein
MRVVWASGDSVGLTVVDDAEEVTRYWRGLVRMVSAALGAGD